MPKRQNPPQEDLDKALWWDSLADSFWIPAGAIFLTVLGIALIFLVTFLLVILTESKIFIFIGGMLAIFLCFALAVLSATKFKYFTDPIHQCAEEWRAPHGLLPYIETFTPRLKTNDQIHIEVVIYTSSQTDHAKLRIRNALAASLAKYLSLRDTTPTFEEALIVIDTSLDALLAEYEIYVCYAELSACYNPLYTAPPPQQPPQPPPTRRRGLLGETHNG